MFESLADGLVYQLIRPDPASHSGAVLHLLRAHYACGDPRSVS